MKIKARYRIKKTLIGYEPVEFCCDSMERNVNNFCLSEDGRIILKSKYGHPNFDLEVDMFEVHNCPFCGEKIKVEETLE